MGYGLMYKYEDFYCTDPCEHIDCEKAKKFSNHKCKHCGEIVQPGEAYYIGDDKMPKHAKCVWEEIENRKD